MTPERIAELSHGYAEFCAESDFLKIKKEIQDAIGQALKEENRWFYPEKGELPKDKSKIIFCPNGRKEHIFGKFVALAHPYGDMAFYNIEDPCLYGSHQVKCWRYAPEVPE